ncbi:MAG: gamma-glutamyltransferase [Parerythrobacter sp.]
MLRFLAAPLALFGLTACQTAAPVQTTDVQPAVAQPAFVGAVSAADVRAEAAGMAMLERGGSATDAAIAIMLALTVVEPQSSGIGGGGFLVRGAADGMVLSYDGRETAPAGATPDWFRAPDGSLPSFGESVRSGLSVGVPGNVRLAALAHGEHGTLPWPDLFQPAIALAQNGFTVNPRLNTSLASATDRAALTAEGRALYFDGDVPKSVGSTITNPSLAATLRRIAAGGAQAFYTGDSAAALASTVADATPRAGSMTPADVSGYAAKARDPVCGLYRAHRVCGMGPPTSGGIAVLQILGQLERFDLAALGAKDPRTWHLFLESQRLAYADRELYAADMDFQAVPVAGLLDPAYLAKRSALIDPARALSNVAAGRPAGAPLAPADGDEPAEHGTSHFAVVGADGTMVSYTSTIEGAFGSGLMHGGFFLNNELTDFSRAAEVDGRLVANRVEGGKRPRSSMSPMVVYDPAGAPLLVIGAAGGGTIPVQTARSIVGVIDFGMTADEALAMPFIMAFGSRVFLEKGTWLEEAQGAFEALGHSETIIRDGSLKANAILRQGDRWVTARDPRLAQQIALP